MFAGNELLDAGQMIDSVDSCVAANGAHRANDAFGARHRRRFGYVIRLG
jgi:hypothetical protein